MLDEFNLLCQDAPRTATKGVLLSASATTPLLAHEPFDEEAVVRAIVARKPSLVLAASDLHLCLGQDPVTGLYNPGENFFGGEAFARWLAAHTAPGESRLLMLGGDLLDFTRIDACPDGDLALADWSGRLARLGRILASDQLARTVGYSDRTFGLRTDDFKSVWKLWRMLDGHPGVVAALARWLLDGNTVILLMGNHDLELYWPLVRLAFRDAILQAGGDDAGMLAAVTTRLAFALAGFDLANIRFEHGHQYEGMTKVLGEATLGRDRQELRYPLGSFMNRYLINGFERISPFLDNVKPVDKAVLALVRKHPLKTVRNYARAWRFVWRALRLGGPKASVIAITVGLVLPPLVVLAIACFLLVPSAWRAVQEALPFLRGRGAETAVGGGLLSALYPYILSAVMELLYALRILRHKDEVREAAEAFLKRAPVVPWRRRYLVLGHTHAATVVPVAVDGGEAFYLNTGTWIPTWAEDRQDLAGRIIYSYIRFDLDGYEYRHRMLEWDDQAGEGRPARLFGEARG